MTAFYERPAPADSSSKLSSLSEANLSADFIYCVMLFSFLADIDSSILVT